MEQRRRKDICKKKRATTLQRYNGFGANVTQGQSKDKALT